MNKITKIITIAVFLSFIGLFFVLMLAMPDVEFSQQENRYLQQLPSFSLQALSDGKFTANFESYTTDQFPFRDAWTALKARCELLMGKKENNGVYYCEGGSALISRFEAPSEASNDENVFFLNRLVENVSTPVYFGLIPGSAEIWSSRLPENAPMGSQQAVIDRAYGQSQAQCIDLSSALRAHADEYIYYRTDHHWTSLGAYYGYGALCETWDLPIPSLSDYDRQIVSGEFYGTTYSSSGFSWVRPDEIETFVPDDGTAVVTDFGSNGASEPLYDTSFLSLKDKYSMFLGGNSSLLSIDTGHEGGKLLIIRDSYSDSLAPFLLENFSQIDLIDLRYYKNSLSAYVESGDFDAVLVLYSVDTFSTDQNLFLLSM